MRNLLISLLLVLFAAGSHYAQPFSYLTKINIDRAVDIHYAEDISKLLTKRLGEYGDEFTQILQTKMDRNKQTEYVISFSQGPSGDPTFLIERIEGRSLVQVGYIPGHQLYIPGNGFFYSSGHTNNMFNQRHKWKVSRGELAEVPQPYYYVGLETKTLQPFTLYADEGLNVRTAELPAGYDITVLINRQNLYLIKTAFGLTGWIEIKNISQTDLPEYGGTGIKGLFYAGD